MRSIVWLSLSFACAVGIVVGCGDDDGASPGGTASPPASVEKRIDEAGGTVEGPGGVTIEIPPGALTAPANVTVAADSAVATDATAVGSTWLFGPEGLQFAKPVKVTLPFDATKLPAGRIAADIRIVTAAKGTTAWTALATTAGGTAVSAEVSHFSYFSPTVLDCRAQCSGDQGSCSCSSTCLGATYSLACTSGQCTCQDGKTGSATSCTDPRSVSKTFRDLCAFPGPIDGDPPSSDDGGADASSGDCTVSCNGDGQGMCSCTATCADVAYAMSCSAGVCSCSKGGVVQKSTDNDCSSASSVCSSFTTGCGFPLTCSVD